MMATLGGLPSGQVRPLHFDDSAMRATIGGRRPDPPRIRPLFALALLVSLLGALSVGLLGTPGHPHTRLVATVLMQADGLGASLHRALGLDQWTTYIERGDALSRHRSAAPTRARMTPRAAYLLAFHVAQDAGNVPGMLVAADRLARLGEHELAHHAANVALNGTLTASARPPGEPPQKGETRTP